jgi:hypothetical protein
MRRRVKPFISTVADKYMFPQRAKALGECGQWEIAAKRTRSLSSSGHISWQDETSRRFGESCMSGKYSAEWWQRIAAITGEYVQSDRNQVQATSKNDNKENDQRKEVRENPPDV